MDEFRNRKEPYKPMVYICSPYSGDTQHNTEQAKKYSRFAYEQGAIPMTPHLLYPQFMCDENLSLTLVKVKNGYKPSNYAGCSHSPFRNDLCYFFVSSVLVLFIMLRIVDFEINS